ncbi:MAG: hypothetical protein JXQ69_03750 [Paludibacteraceae bacterium]|nr:hypothetical protein [Paludibacteraceae bacterium]
MALTYKTCDPTTPVEHFCDSCGEGEKGRVRSVGLIDKSVTIAIPYVLLDWTAAIEAGTITIIPETNGTFDGGTPKYVPGFGDKKEKKIGDDYVLTYKDPNYAENIAYYEALEKGDITPSWRTESLLHIAKDAQGVQVNVKSPVEDDVDSIVVHIVEIKWFSKTKPLASPVLPIIDLFECFEVTTGV